ncbi:Rab GTPase-activating protein 1-like [Liparis tanakae]|uniref:Rab GTPase-activating protein 1-like n=1 Tax=Liparis tanakae TaxID=230148 RepID=A0A4Z2EKN2_9TELE|nr:Rab GTPase-activating protein 1-like [Liparis tanakae]
MDDPRAASLGKVSGSTESVASVATVTSEEFVLIQSSAAGSPQGSEGKPRLKVGTRGTQTLDPPPGWVT